MSRTYQDVHALYVTMNEMVSMEEQQSECAMPGHSHPLQCGERVEMGLFVEDSVKVAIREVLHDNGEDISVGRVAINFSDIRRPVLAITRFSD